MATPNKQDARLAILLKILGALNNVNGGSVASPSFFPEGSSPNKQDTEWKLLQKILGAANAIPTTFPSPATDGASAIFKNNNFWFKDQYGQYHLASCYVEEGQVQTDIDNQGYNYEDIP